MSSLENKKVLVLGLGASGLAACDLLRRCGAQVTAVDSADSPTLRDTARVMREQGMEAYLGVCGNKHKGSGAKAADLTPDTSHVTPDFAVISPGVPNELALVRDLKDRR